MSGINSTDVVKRQYASAGNLNTRISIHDKYSTNKTGFGNWIFSNYRIDPGMKVLELGCGTGSMWKNREPLIRACAGLVLSDLSEGMVATARENVGSHENVEYRIIDIQEIPYENGAFDAVIANMMLYHVPDIGKGLAEVRRVLKPGGRFYSATHGEHGIVEYLSRVLSAYGVEDHVNRHFTLQNGRGILSRVFSQIEMLEYEDSLAVTNIDDLVEYIYSLSGMTPLNSVPKQTIREVLRQKTVNGVLNVPKEYGMFISR